MKLYKDIQGNYWFKDTIIVAGNYKLKVNESKTTISIYSYDRDIPSRGTALYNIPVVELQKENGTNYTSFEDFYSAISYS